MKIFHDTAIDTLVHAGATFTSKVEGDSKHVLDVPDHIGTELLTRNGWHRFTGEASVAEQAAGHVADEAKAEIADLREQVAKLAAALEAGQAEKAESEPTAPKAPPAKAPAKPAAK